MMSIKRALIYFVIAVTAAVVVMGTEPVKADGLETAISEENFPDENLRKYVAGFDTDGNGSLSKGEIDAVTSFEIPQKTASLEGMQIFSNLEKIMNDSSPDSGVGFLYVDEIDFTCFPRLSFVSLGIEGKDKISKINLSGLEMLKDVTIFANEGTYYKYGTVDVSNCPKLEDIGIYYAEKVDITGDKNLKEIRLMSVKKLPMEQINALAELEELWLTSNDKAAAELELSDKTAMKNLFLRGNYFELPDVSVMPNLERLYLFRKNIAGDLDLSNNWKLSTLYLKSTAITSIDLEGNSVLDWVEIINSNVTELDFSTRTLAIFKTDILKNKKLKKVTIGDQPRLIELNCRDNPRLKTIDIGSAPKLRQFVCRDNALTSLDVSGCKNLVYLSCLNNQLKELDVTGLDSLKSFYYNKSVKVTGWDK